MSLKDSAQFLVNQWGIQLVDEWPPKNSTNDLMDRYEPVFKKLSKT